MNGHSVAGERAIRRDAIASKNLLLAVTLLALLTVTGCSGRLTPAATSTVASVPVAQTSAPTSIPATPSVRKPTATSVPLITPSPTPEGVLVTRLTVPRISIEVARRMADAGEAVLVDVRTRATFEQAHIAGAISLPATELLDRYRELPADRLVIFY